MNSYVLKNSDEEKKVLLYEEKTSYSFSPKKGYKRVKKITVLDQEILSKILEEKVTKSYNKLIKIIYDLINSEDTTSGDILVTFTEIDRIKDILLYKYNKKLKKEFIDKYLKKLYLLEQELKKININTYDNFLKESKGKGR